ncbi:MAG TPA: 2-dehydropantoate 2-reductase [Thermodesulfobacteriaceae bacterium]|nr:2-dehydropantoate 2-reductase [Thermodesulfobacteriaceae bacterium]
MKVVIVGAGAIGRLFGAMLGRGGNEVIFVEKDQEVGEAVNSHGIQLMEQGVTDRSVFITVDARATTDGASIKDCDLIVLAVKDYATSEAVGSIAHLASPDSPVLTIQTGLGNVETISRIVGSKSCLGGLTFQAAIAVSGSMVRHSGAGETLIGELDGRRTERVEKIQKVFEGSGLKTRIAANITGHIWEKVIIYSAIHPLTAILRIKNGQLTEKMESIALARRIIDEGKMVAQAYAVHLPDLDLYDLFLDLCHKTFENFSPMLQDLLHNRLTEIEGLNGAIFNMGKQKGVATPIHQTVTDLIHLLEKWGISHE